MNKEYLKKVHNISIYLTILNGIILLFYMTLIGVAQASSIDIQNGQNIVGESVTQGYKFIQHNNMHTSSFIQQALASNGNQNATNSSNNPPNMEITFGSFLLSALIVLFLFFFVYWWTKFGKRSDKTQGSRTRLVDIMEVRKRSDETQKSDKTQESQIKLGDIIRDGSGFPSLARFQFLIWTLIVTFAVLSVSFIRLFMGVPEILNDIPENLLILMGISIGVPFVSNPISSIKYGERKPPTGTLGEEDRRPLATMLMENDKPTVSRFQMFAWTIISIIVYLGFFFSQTVFVLNDVNELEVPDIPQIFVYLMGLSQAGYVGVKGTLSKSLAVTQVSPKEVHIGKEEDVIIVGTNFGSERGSVIFEDGPRDTAGNQFPVPPESENIKEWQETRIHITMPKDLTAAGYYYIRVQNRGLISYKGGGLDDEARIKIIKEEKQDEAATAGQKQ